MANDFYSCGNYLTLDQILLNLIDDVDTLSESRAFCGIRTVAATIATRDIQPINCTSKDEFIQLLRQALCTASDGRMALRIIYTAHVSGLALNPMSCVIKDDFWQRLGRCFVHTDDGKVAMYFANIT